MQYLNEQDLNAVKGLIHYLNENLQADTTGLTAEVSLIDSNGEAAGVIKESSGPGGYALHFPEFLEFPEVGA